MYAALMTGIANHLCRSFNYEPSQVRYGGTDDFWNKHNMERVRTPGLIYGSTAISFPRGLSAHGNEYLGSTNTSETVGIRVRPILFTAAITMGMVADNEEDHFDQIHKYIEMAAFHGCLSYRVSIPGMDLIEDWESTISEFSELSPAPGGRDTNTYDTEGRLYKLEATFTVNSQFYVTDEQKLIRCVFMRSWNDTQGDSKARILGKDSANNRFPFSRK